MSQWTETHSNATYKKNNCYVLKTWAGCRGIAGACPTLLIICTVLHLLGCDLAGGGAAGQVSLHGYTATQVAPPSSRSMSSYKDTRVQLPRQIMT